MEDSQLNSQELEGTTTSGADLAESTSPATEAPATVEPTSLRDAVLKAYEKTAAPAAEAVEQAPVESKPAEPVAPAEDIDPITGEKLEPIKAPGGLTPALREKWGGVPREMQKYWVDRERDMSMRLQETAAERKLASDFKEVVAPYEALMRQHSINAITHAKELFNFDYVLQMGTPQQKAQIIDKIIRQSQPDIPTLVALANGQGMPQQATPQVDVQAEVNRALATQREQEGLQRANSAIERFAADPKNEFYGDVSDLMGKAVELGLVPVSDDVEATLRAAYDWATKNHPEVSQVIAGRAPATSAVATTAPAPKPVPSAKPSLGSGARNEPAKRYTSTRDAAAAAWDRLSRD